MSYDTVGNSVRSATKPLGDESGEGAHAQRQREIGHEYQGVENRAIGEAALFPKQKWKTGAADVVGASRPAQHGGEAAIGTEMRRRQVEEAEEEQTDAKAQREPPSACSQHIRR